MIRMILFLGENSIFCFCCATFHHSFCNFCLLAFSPKESDMDGQGMKPINPFLFFFYYFSILFLLKSFEMLFIYLFSFYLKDEEGGGTKREKVTEIGKETAHLLVRSLSASAVAVVGPG